MTQSDTGVGKPTLTFSDDGEPIIIPPDVEKEMFKLNETKNVEQVTQSAKKPPVRGPKIPGKVAGVQQKEKQKVEVEPLSTEEPEVEVEVLPAEEPKVETTPVEETKVEVGTQPERDTEVRKTTSKKSKPLVVSSNPMTLSEFAVSAGSTVSDIKNTLFGVAKKYCACIHTTINIKDVKYYVASVACVIGGVRVLLRNSDGTNHVCLLCDGVSFKEEHCVCDGKYFIVKDFVVAHVEPYNKVLSI